MINLYTNLYTKVRFSMYNLCEKKMNGNCWWIDRPTDSSKAYANPSSKGGINFFHYMILKSVKMTEHGEKPITWRKFLKTTMKTLCCIHENE